jgi:hypothetical protein
VRTERPRSQLLNHGGQFSWRDLLISAAGEFCDGVPIHFIQIQTNRDPAFRPKVGRHKETNRIIFDQTTLLAQARLTGESDHAVTMMIKEVIGKDSLADAKGDVLIASHFGDYFGQRLADFDETRASWH